MNRREFIKSAAALAVASAFPLPALPEAETLLRGELGVWHGFRWQSSIPFTEGLSWKAVILNSQWHAVVETAQDEKDREMYLAMTRC
jgi:hypothetical protein